MPLGFDKIPGEVAVYAERGTSSSTTGTCGTARPGPPSTAASAAGVRGCWFGGERPVDDSDDIFVKNAAR